MSYVLHYAPDNASLIVRLVLEELGVPYRTLLVDRAVRAQDGAAYRALNPAGLIPALETEDGPLFETAAILLWLSDRHAAMAPPPRDPARGGFLSRLFFVSNTLHAQLRMLFYPEKYVGSDQDAQARLRAHLTAHAPPTMTLPRALDLMEAYVAAQPAAAAPGILDCYCAAILRWCALYPDGHTRWFDLTDYPALSAAAAALETRASTRALQAAEGLGPAPFTAPRPATPPEGSAL